MRPKKLNKTEPKLPIEAWSLIFPRLPFKDQVKCRQICKDWCDLITTLPTFTEKNTLKLDSCHLSRTDPPVTTLLNKKCKLQFKSMIVEAPMTLTVFPTLKNFFTKIGETLTYLDVTYTVIEQPLVRTDNLRIIVENLNLFKVLSHFKISRLSEWITIAYSTSPGKEVLQCILLIMLEKNIESYESARRFFDTKSIVDKFKLDIFFSRYKGLLLEKIKDNIDGLRNDQDETVSIIIQEVEDAIKEADKGIDLSTRTNTSVRTVTFQSQEGTAEDDIERMLRLIPNVQEINFDSNALEKLAVGTLKLIEKFPEKITSLLITDENMERLKKLNLYNLRHVNVGKSFGDSDSWYPERRTDCLLELFPTIESITAIDNDPFPQAHFDFITDLTLVLNPVTDGDLSGLNIYSKLHKLTIIIQGGREGVCFFGHKPLTLNSIKYLDFTIPDEEKTCCVQCVETMLQSVPNAYELIFGQVLYLSLVKAIFKYCPANVFKLDVTNLHDFTFIEPDDWAFMENIKIFNMRGVVIWALTTNDSDEDRLLPTINFWSKFKSLKLVEVQKHPYAHLPDEVWAKANMPALQKVRLSQLTFGKSSELGMELISTKTVKSGNRKIVLDKLIVN